MPKGSFSTVYAHIRKNTLKYRIAMAYIIYSLRVELTFLVELYFISIRASHTSEIHRPRSFSRQFAEPFRHALLEPLAWRLPLTSTSFRVSFLWYLCSCEIKIRPSGSGMVISLQNLTITSSGPLTSFTPDVRRSQVLWCCLEVVNIWSLLLL